MGAEPSKPTDDSKTLHVIGAGYSRTGTLSMTLALEKLLDGPVMHGGSQFLGREDAYVKLWYQILRARADKPVLLKLLKKATAGFVAVTDAPANHFIPELLELYPDAIVVCVSRDPIKWWASWSAVVAKATPSWLKYLLAPVPGKRWYPYLVEEFGKQQEEVFGPMGPGRMEQHNDYVRSVTPKRKLVEMELNDGWSPLCKALDVEVPKEDFPRVNDADAVEGLEGQIFLEAAKIWGLIIAGVIVCVCMFWFFSDGRVTGRRSFGRGALAQTTFVKECERSPGG